MLVSALMVMVVPLEAAPSMSVWITGCPPTLVISKASSNRSLSPSWLWLAATRRARYSRAWSLRTSCSVDCDRSNTDRVSPASYWPALWMIWSICRSASLCGARTMRKLSRLETWRLLISRLNSASWCSRLS
ncbi:hypothetical protein D3C78_1454270 [compost metagenome]